MLAISVLSLIGLVWLSAYADNTNSTNTDNSNFYQAKDCTKANVPVCGIVTYKDGTIGKKDFPNLCALTKEAYYKPLYEGDCSFLNGRNHGFGKILMPGVVKEIKDKGFMTQTPAEKNKLITSYIEDFTKEIKPLKDKNEKELSAKEQKTIDVIEGVILNFKILKYAFDYNEAI